MDEETKEVKNHLSTIQSCLQEIESIAKSLDNDDAEFYSQMYEEKLYTLAEMFGLSETDF